MRAHEIYASSAAFWPIRSSHYGNFDLIFQPLFLRRFSIVGFVEVWPTQQLVVRKEAAYKITGTFEQKIII